MQIDAKAYGAIADDVSPTVQWGRQGHCEALRGAAGAALGHDADYVCLPSERENEAMIASRVGAEY